MAAKEHAQFSKNSFDEKLDLEVVNTLPNFEERIASFLETYDIHKIKLHSSYCVF